MYCVIALKMRLDASNAEQNCQFYSLYRFVNFWNTNTKGFWKWKTVKQTVVFLGGCDKCIKVHKISASIVVKKIIKYEENKTKINYNNFFG